jgi:Flp pilus assembly protein TadG
MSIRSSSRRGVVAVKVAVLLIPITAFTALAVDCGYLLKVRTDLQSAADAAALAAVRELVPESGGAQDTNAARDTARTYGQDNMGGSSSFTINDADIEIGRYDPSTIYSDVSLLSSGTFDAVRVTVRRDDSANSAVQLYFARLIGIGDCDVTATATAVLPRASGLYVGDGVLPFAVHQSVWENHGIGDQFKAYNGKIVDAYGTTVSGNWGTVDIGETNNSTSDLSDQIRNGLRQKDLDALYDDGRIDSNEYIDTAQDIMVQADTGLSSGLKHAVQDIHGQIRYIPIYASASGNGNNAEFQIVDWGVVQVVTSNWNGSKNTYITFEKTSTYDGKLTPHPDLSDTSNTISGAYSHPILVE